jgi:Cu/Ag efflux pump CusA
MIDRFVDYALSKRLVVAMVWAFVSIYGHCSWTQLAIEAYPDNPNTGSQAVAQAPGMTAKEG